MSEKKETHFKKLKSGPSSESKKEKQRSNSHRSSEESSFVPSGDSLAFDRSIPGLIQGKRLTPTSAQVDIQAFIVQANNGGYPRWAVLKNHQNDPNKVEEKREYVNPFPPPKGFRDRNAVVVQNTIASTSKSAPHDNNDNVSEKKKKSKGLLSCIHSSSDEDNTRPDPEGQPPATAAPTHPHPSAATTHTHRKESNAASDSDSNGSDNNNSTVAPKNPSVVVVHPPPKPVEQKKSKKGGIFSCLFPSSDSDNAAPDDVKSEKPSVHQQVTPKRKSESDSSGSGESDDPSKTVPPLHHVSFSPNAKTSSGNAGPGPHIQKAEGSSGGRSSEGGSSAKSDRNSSDQSKRTSDGSSGRGSESTGSSSKRTSGGTQGSGGGKKQPSEHSSHHSSRHPEDANSSESSEAESTNESVADMKKGTHQSHRTRHQTHNAGGSISDKLEENRKPSCSSSQAAMSQQHQSAQIPPPGSIRYGSPFPGIPIVDRKQQMKDGRNFDVSQEVVHGKYDSGGGGGYPPRQSQSSKQSSQKSSKSPRTVQLAASRSSRIDVSVNKKYQGGSTIRTDGRNDNVRDGPPSQALRDHPSNVNVFINKSVGGLDDVGPCEDEEENGGWDENACEEDAPCCCPCPCPCPPACPPPCPLPCPPLCPPPCCPPPCPPCPCPPTPMPIPYPIPLPLPIPSCCPPSCPPCCSSCCSPCCSPRCCCCKKKKKKKKNDGATKDWNLITMYGMYTLFQQMHTTWQSQMQDQFARCRPPCPQYGLMFANPMQMMMQMMNCCGQGCCPPPPCNENNAGPNPIFEVTGMEFRGGDEC